MSTATTSKKQNTKRKTQAKVEAESIKDNAQVFEGKVTGCNKLNVREHPFEAARIVTVIEQNSEVMIDLNTSSDDFFRVCTGSGIDGYCMRKYISVCK